MTKTDEPTGEDVVAGNDVACKGTRGCAVPARHRCPHCRRPLCGRHAKLWGDKGRVCHKCRYTFEDVQASPPAALAIPDRTRELEEDVDDNDDLDSAPASAGERLPPGTTVFVIDRDRAARRARIAPRGRALLDRTWRRSSARTGERITVIGSNAALAPATSRVRCSSAQDRVRPATSRAHGAALPASPPLAQIPLFG
jgi:hypothetical protein